MELTDQYKREAQYLELQGMNLTLPVDRLPKTKVRILENVRVFGSGAVRGRQGVMSIGGAIPGAAGQTHSLFTLNDPVPSPSSVPAEYNTHARLAGIGTKLFGAQTAGGLGSYTALDTGFSGNPLSFLVTPSDFTPRPWVFVGDSLKDRKVSSSQTREYPLGVAPPNFAPTIAFGAANADGPDIGATGNPYVYAFRARLDTILNTGAISNLGPAVRTVNGLSPSSAPGAATPPTNIIVTLPSAHPDPQVKFIDVFRFGGSIPSFIFIGSMPNIAAGTMIDSFNDLVIENNEFANQDDNQPFLSVDTTRVGTCTVAAAGVGLGGTVTITGGDTLRAYNATGDTPYYPAGNQISINGTAFTFYRSPTSTTSVEILEDPQGVVGGTFIIDSPEMAHQPVACMWGPYGGGITGIFNFACADALNPGNLYWTKGNHPESHPGTNTLTITSASEPLMNGLMYGSEPYVFSTDRLFRIYPNLGGVTDFVALQVPNSKGLYARWGLTSTPYGIAFVGKDGIYLTAGGPPQSLTDEDLYPIFPHEGDGSDPTSYIAVDGMNDPDPLLVPIAKVDFTAPANMRLAYGDGFLYFDFKDTDGFYRTMVYNFQTKGWVSRDSHFPNEVNYHYYETIEDSVTPSLNRRAMMVGSVDALVGEFGGTTDWGSAIGSRIRPGSYDGGDPRPRKKWGDIELDIDTQCDNVSVLVGMDNFSYFTNANPTGLSLRGRRRVTLDINNGEGQYGYNIGVDISWINTEESIVVLYYWLPTWVPEPELTAMRFSDQDDCGYPGDKFIQGFKLRADTLGVARTVQVWDELGASHAFTPTTIQHNRESTIAYSFNAPFLSHLVRFAPQDANFWRIKNVEWIYAIAPDSVQTWTSQELAFGLNGWFSHQNVYLALLSTATVMLTITAKGNPASPFTYTIPSTAGVYQKVFFNIAGAKCKAASYSLTSTQPFRLFAKDCEMDVKQWGSTGPYVAQRPFGDITAEPMPARI